jgi:hypothetical protein
VSAEDDERSGQPSTTKMTANVEKIPELIHEDCYRITHELADTTQMLWNLPDLNRKFEHVPHCSFITTMHLPTRP